MTKVSRNADFRTWIMQWIARIVSTLLMVFILMWVIGSTATWRENRAAPWPTSGEIVMTVCFLTLLAIVVISWFREGLGGTLLSIVGFAASIGIMIRKGPGHYLAALIFGVPLLISGILYLICWRRIKKKNAAR